MSTFGRISGTNSGSKLGRWYCSMGLSSWVMAFLMASDKQSSKSIFLLSHFVNVGAETVIALSKDFLQARNNYALFWGRKSSPNTRHSKSLTSSILEL
jgi:hypothetical protein